MAISFLWTVWWKQRTLNHDLFHGTSSIPAIPCFPGFVLASFKARYAFLNVFPYPIEQVMPSVLSPYMAPAQ
jgi:hypothetical protein